MTQINTKHCKSLTRLLVFSHLFPTETAPHNGIFVYEQLHALLAHTAVQAIFCIVRTPVFIPKKPLKSTLKALWAYAKALYSCQPVVETTQNTSLAVLRLPVIHRGFLPMASRPLLFAMALTGWLLCRPIMRGRWLANTAVIHAHTGFIDGVVAALVAFLFKKPLFITEHTGPLSAITQPWTVGIQTRWAYRQARHVIGVSQAMASAVQAELPPDMAPKVLILPNSVDTTQFSPSPLPPRPPHQLLCIASFDDNKNQTMLITAVALLRQQHLALQETRLTLIGQGQLPQDNRLDTIPEWVTLLPAQPHDTLPAHIARHHALVLASKVETFGVVLIEALACGRPIASTPCGGPQDIITRQTGCLSDDFSPQAMTNALSQLLLGLNQYCPHTLAQHAQQQYGHLPVSQKLAQYYATVLHY